MSGTNSDKKHAVRISVSDSQLTGLYNVVKGMTEQAKILASAGIDITSMKQDLEHTKDIGLAIGTRLDELNQPLTGLASIVE